MGFWSTLGSIAGLAAIPFTGGASALITGASGVGKALGAAGKVAGAIGDAGKVASGTAAGRAAGRTTQADFNLRAGQAQQGANTQTADTNLLMRKQAIADALRGQMLQGVKDSSVSGLPYGVTMPTLSGGLRPSALGDAASLGKTLQTQGTSALNKSSLPTDMSPVNFSSLAPAPNGYDTGLNVLGTIGNFAGALSPYLKQKQAVKLPGLTTPAYGDYSQPDDGQ